MNILLDTIDPQKKDTIKLISKVVLEFGDENSIHSLKKKIGEKLFLFLKTQFLQKMKMQKIRNALFFEQTSILNLNESSIDLSKTGLTSPCVKGQKDLNFKKLLGQQSLNDFGMMEGRVKQNELENRFDLGSFQRSIKSNPGMVTYRPADFEIGKIQEQIQMIETVNL